jgi:hypothetical protein
MPSRSKKADVNEAAHPEGERGAVASEIAWLRPWLADEAEDATVNDILELLIETTLDPTLLTQEFLAERLVVHPEDFIRYNRGQLEVHEGRGSWILRHRDDKRAPLRVRRGESGGWELLGPSIDDRALRAAARRLERVAALADQPWPVTAAAGIGRRREVSARLVGAELAALAKVGTDKKLRCSRVEWLDGELCEAAVELVHAHSSLDLSSLPECDAESVRVWLAQRGRTPVASLGFAIGEGHCSLGWIVSAEIGRAHV